MKIGGDEYDLRKYVPGGQILIIDDPAEFIWAGKIKDVDDDLEYFYVLCHVLILVSSDNKDRTADLPLKAYPVGTLGKTIAVAHMRGQSAPMCPEGKWSMGTGPRLVISKRDLCVGFVGEGGKLLLIDHEPGDEERALFTACFTLPNDPRNIDIPNP